MKPDSRFIKQPPEFWAYVKIIGQEFGYSERGESVVSAPAPEEIKAVLNTYELATSDLFRTNTTLTKLGQDLLDYFNFRSETLNKFVEPRLMDARRAEKEFEKLKAKLKPTCPLPMNKQKGEKKKPAYLTGIINMLIEANCSGIPCNYDPRELAHFKVDGKLAHVMSRRIDGSFPAGPNPIAIWEIKEYYYTTTFGSRVAGGVYESLLDGFELNSLHRAFNLKCYHLLMVDAHYTWWACGKSYLCRLMDILQMGYCDEILFGYEVIEQLPTIVKEWSKQISHEK